MLEKGACRPAGIEMLGCFGKIAHGFHETKPRAISPACGPRRVTIMKRLGGRRPSVVLIAKSLVIAPNDISALGLPQQGSKNVDGFEVVGHLATGRKFRRSRLQPLKYVANVLVSRHEVKECLDFQKERPVVPDVVDHREVVLALSLAKPPTELLCPKKLRLGGPQHQDCVYVRDVHPLIEHIDCEDHLKLAGFELL